MHRVGLGLNNSIEPILSALVHSTTIIITFTDIILIIKQLEETTTEEWDRTFDINVKGVFFGTKAVLPAMKKSRRGLYY